MCMSMSKYVLAQGSNHHLVHAKPDGALPSCTLLLLSTVKLTLISLMIRVKDYLLLRFPLSSLR